MRSVEGEPALVLRRTEYGESDLIVGLYCRSLGRVSALARAARKSRKRFGAALGFFTLSEVSLTCKAKSTLWTLVGAEPRVSYDSLATNVAAMAHASYGTELIRELSAEEHPDSTLFDLLLELYESLKRAGPRVGRLRVFELRLLRALGLSPQVDACATCGESDLSDRALLDPSRGGLVCARCAADTRGYGARPMSAAAIDYLRRAQQMSTLEDGDALDVLDDAIEARQAMLALLYWHVGKPLKSVEFIAKLSNKG